MMTQQTRDLLEALKSSGNQMTATHAADVLRGKICPVGSTTLTAEELAADGQLGGFLKAVVTGDHQLAWLLADESNRAAIRNLIPVEIRARY
jgi:hypothetical protein